MNRQYQDLGKHRRPGDAEISPESSALAFEPIYEGEKTGWGFEEIVRIEIVSQKEAGVGEIVTVRISIPSARAGEIHMIEICPTHPWTHIQGPRQTTLRGPKAKEIRFTSRIAGKAGIRVIARPMLGQETWKGGRRP